jgi:cytochrome P450
MNSQGLTKELPVSTLQGFDAKPLESLIEEHQRLGDIFATHLRGVPTLICGGRTGPHALFGAERGALEVYNTPAVKGLFGRAIFNLSAAEHRQARRLLQFGLLGPPLENYTNSVMELSLSHVERWSTDIFELYDAVRALTFDFCARIVLGLSDTDQDHQKLSELFETFVRGTVVSSHWWYLHLGYWKGRSAALELRALLRRRVELSRAAPGHNALSYIIGGIDRENTSVVADLPDHLLALLVAGRETTASLITWLLIELACDSRMAEQISADAQLLVASPHLLTSRTAAPTLRAALLEAERLHSPNALSLRQAVDNCNIAGHTVPRGWHVAYSPAANHLLPNLYLDARNFRLTRFTGAGQKLANGLLTFGGGIHACPGKHLAEVLALAVAASVFAKHRVYLLHGRPAAIQYIPVKAPTQPVHATIHSWRGQSR